MVIMRAFLGGSGLRGSSYLALLDSRWRHQLESEARDLSGRGPLALLWLLGQRADDDEPDRGFDHAGCRVTLLCHDRLAPPTAHAQAGQETRYTLYTARLRVRCTQYTCQEEGSVSDGPNGGDHYGSPGTTPEPPEPGPRAPRRCRPRRPAERCTDHAHPRPRAGRGPHGPVQARGQQRRTRGRHYRPRLRRGRVPHWRR